MTADLAEIKRRVLVRYPFFGSVISAVAFEETEDVATTDNDGRTIFYNPGYIDGLCDTDQVFAFAHEICHVAFEHKLRSDGKDQRLWETAADAVINQWLNRDGLDIIKGGVDLPEAIDYDTEEFYELLLSEKLEIDLMEGQLDEGRPISESTPCEDDQDGEYDIEDFVPWDGDEDELPEDLREVTAPAPEAGNSVNPDDREMQQIGNAAPLIDWRLILRDTITYGVDWSFTNAVIEDGIVRPALEERPMPETEIVLDTSWSVEEDLLRNFLRECKNILKHSKLKAGCFDTQFYGFHEIKTDKDIEEMTFEGGGGTDFDVAVGAFSMRVDNRIIFTDGKAPMPQMPLDIIWMVYGDEEIEPQGGRVIHIRPELIDPSLRK